jgi:hypothetical protein
MVATAEESVSSESVSLKVGCAAVVKVSAIEMFPAEIRTPPGIVADAPEGSEMEFENTIGFATVPATAGAVIVAVPNVEPSN